jgi:transcriptional regulator with XRE-family HTH domain
MADSSIHGRIKAVREKLDLSQRDFCKSVFLSPSFYGKLEKGERNANERILELICHRYNVNKSWLKTGKGDMFNTALPDVELDQLVEIIRELDPLFREYIIQQIKQFADFHRKSKEKPTDKNKKPH